MSVPGEDSPLPSPAPVAESFCSHAERVALAAVALGRRMINIKRGHEDGGPVHRQRGLPPEPDWSRLVAAVQAIEPDFRRASGAAFDRVKERLKLIGRRVNTCQHLLGQGLDNPLYELGPEFFSEGYDLWQALKELPSPAPACAPWAEEGAAVQGDARQTPNSPRPATGGPAAGGMPPPTSHRPPGANAPIDTRPASPLPPAALVEAATRLVPAALANLTNTTEYGAGPPAAGQRIVGYAGLVRALLEQHQQNKAAVEWAIHGLAERGLLVLRRGESCTPGLVGPGGGWVVAPIRSKVPDLNCALIETTAALWDWWRACAPELASYPAHPGSAHAEPPPLDPPRGEHRPVLRLQSWREILSTLQVKNDAQNRRRVRELNVQWQGPIILPHKGGQPKVDKDKLLAWWNRLDDRFQELQQRQSDQQATVADQHPYGRQETVVPEIQGHIDQRRKRAP